MKKDSTKNLKTRKMRKNLRNAYSKVDLSASYEVENAIKLIGDAAYTKFDSTLDVVMKLNVDPRHSDQMVRGVVVLPFGTGKVMRVAVVCKDERISEAKAAGADLVGSSDIIAEIKSGKINFDVCVATPDMMSVISSVAKILGPKGLMPNPKLGTVTTDISSAVKNVKNGQVEFRVEKAGIIHAGVGKLSFASSNLVANVKAFMSAVVKARPSGARGVYLQAAYLSSTMGPALKLDLSSIQ